MDPTSHTNLHNSTVERWLQSQVAGLTLAVSLASCHRNYKNNCSSKKISTPDRFSQRFWVDLERQTNSYNAMLSHAMSCYLIQARRVSYNLVRSQAIIEIVTFVELILFVSFVLFHDMSHLSCLSFVEFVFFLLCQKRFHYTN